MTPSSQLFVLPTGVPEQSTQPVPTALPSAVDSTSSLALDLTKVASSDVISEGKALSAPSTAALFTLDYSGKSTKGKYGSYKIGGELHDRLLTIGLEHNLSELIHVLLGLSVVAGRNVLLLNETSFARYSGLVAATTDEELLQMARDIEQFFVDKKKFAVMKAQKSLSTTVPPSPEFHSIKFGAFIESDLEVLCPGPSLPSAGSEPLWSSSASGFNEPSDSSSDRPVRSRRVRSSQLMHSPLNELLMEELESELGLFPENGSKPGQQVMDEIPIGFTDEASSESEDSESEDSEKFGMVTTVDHIAYMRDVGFYTQISPGVRAVEGDVPSLEFVDGMWDYIADDDPKLRKPGLPLDHRIAVIKKVAEGYKDLADNRVRTQELNRFFTKEHKEVDREVKRLTRIQKANTPRSFACFPIQLSARDGLADLAAMGMGPVVSGGASSSTVSKKTQEITTLEQVEYLRGEGAGVRIAKNVLGGGKIFDLLNHIQTEKDSSRAPSIELYDALLDTCREEDNDYLHCFFIVEREQIKSSSVSGSKKRKMPESSLFFRRNGLAGTVEEETIYHNAEELDKMSASRLSYGKDQQCHKSYQ